MGPMSIEPDENEQRDHDYPAADAQPTTNQAGGQTDEHQLPGFYSEVVSHRATLGLNCLTTVSYV